MEVNKQSAELLDALMKEALLEVLQEECDELDGQMREHPEDCIPSDRRIRRIIIRQHLISGSKKTFKIALRVVVVLLVTATVAGITLMSVEATRNRIFQMFIEWHEDHVSIDFNQK